MRFIQCLSDIEYLRVQKILPMAFIKVITQDFLGICEAENQDDIYNLLTKLSFVINEGSLCVGKRSNWNVE